MEQLTDKSNGRIYLSNGDIFYSPNCSRDVDVPLPLAWGDNPVYRILRSVLWQSALHQSGCVYPGGYVRYGPDLVLLGHFPMVHHLEHNLFRLPVIHG